MNSTLNRMYSMVESMGQWIESSESSGIMSRVESRIQSWMNRWSTSRVKNKKQEVEFNCE